MTRASSESLLAKKCVPCEGGVCPLRSDELKPRLEQLNSNWQIREDLAAIDDRYSPAVLERKYTFRDYKTAQDYMNKVGEIAEAEGHHPEVRYTWGSGTIRLWTHAIRGLSENDFILAAKIDQLEQ